VCLKNLQAQASTHPRRKKSAQKSARKTPPSLDSPDLLPVQGLVREYVFQEQAQFVSSAIIDRPRHLSGAYLHGSAALRPRDRRTKPSLHASSPEISSFYLSVDSSKILGVSWAAIRKRLPL
jgi:hypothetical protein